MNIELPITSEQLAHIDARKVYLNGPDSREYFDSMIEKGDASITIVGDGESCDAIRTFFPPLDVEGVDFSNIPTGTYTVEEEAEQIPEEQRAIFSGWLRKRVADNAFNVSWGMHNAWWIDSGWDKGKDSNKWLDTAKLHNVGVLSVDDKKMVVNDFSGKVDIDKVYKGLNSVARDYVEKGINIVDYVTTFNILPEDSPGFAIDDATRARLGNDPKLYVQAAAGSKGLFLMNEMTLLDDFSNIPLGEDGRPFAVSRDWSDVFAHELAHFLDRGIDGAEGSTKVANKLGWFLRCEVLTDDYGNLIELERQLFGTSIVDDFGNDIFISNLRQPQILLSSGINKNGFEIRPPSRYAEESAGEDIAESFAAYITGNVQLDDARLATVSELAEERATLKDDSNINITVAQHDPHTFNPYEYLPRHLRVRSTFVHF